MARNEDGNTPLHTAAGWSSLIEELERHQRHAGAAVVALLEAGADPLARNEAGETPWDLAQANELLRGSDAYWRLNDARFDAPARDVRRQSSAPSAATQAATSPLPQPRGPGCQIPGYPTPTNVQSLGLSWCGPDVDFQKRAFALQAAGAWCAIAGGSSSTPEQISARHQEINSACDTLEALQARLGGRPCQCPAGYRP